MSGSSFGTILKCTTWGESHGPALGVVIDGMPAGISLTKEHIQPYLNRRKPGANPYATPRKEDDEVEILSGVFEGKTTGTPISIMIRIHPSAVGIILRYHSTIVRDMQILDLTQNTASATIAAAAVLQDVKQLHVLLPVQLQCSY